MVMMHSELSQHPNDNKHVIQRWRKLVNDGGNTNASDRIRLKNRPNKTVMLCIHIDDSCVVNEVEQYCPFTTTNMYALEPPLIPPLMPPFSPPKINNIINKILDFINNFFDIKDYIDSINITFNIFVKNLYIIMF